MIIDFPNTFKTLIGFCGSDFFRIVYKQNRFFRIGFAKLPSEYLGYSGYGACGVHTEKIIYVCT